LDTQLWLGRAKLSDAIRARVTHPVRTPAGDRLGAKRTWLDGSGRTSSRTTPQCWRSGSRATLLRPVRDWPGVKSDGPAATTIYLVAEELGLDGVRVVERVAEASR
jgi:hypothetical protein